MGRFRTDHLITAVLCIAIMLVVSSTSAAGVVYVKWDSPGTGSPAAYDGKSWATAYHKIQDGINAALAGGEVWVAAGTYVERITLKKDAGLYGGFNGTETDRSQRKWTTNVTIIDGNRGGSVVTSPAGATEATVIDGFTITNGTGSPAGTTYGSGGGIHCSASSPTIENNTITGNWPFDGGGIYCVGYASPRIVNNKITNNHARSGPGGGILCRSSSSPLIADNTITDNEAGWPGGGGIFCRDFCSPTIKNNEIRGNGGGGWGGGIGCYSSPAKIINNNIKWNTGADGGGIWCGYHSDSTISGNTITENLSSGSGGGLYCATSSLKVINNTIVGNRVWQGFGGGVFWLEASGTIINNIIAFNSSGIYRTDSGDTPLLRTNCLYNPDGPNYSGLTAGAGDIRANPKLVAAEYGRVHLQPNSPCIDSGDDSVVQPEDLDMDGQARIQGAHVDIGADESDGTLWQFATVVVRVSPNGNDANDGLSWASAKRTLQAALDSAGLVGGEVWAAAGTYPEAISIPRYAFLCGGFAGTEAFRYQRDPTKNTTVLDGGQAYGVVQFLEGYRTCGIDGFTIRNGRDRGLYCAFSAPVISGNVITQNDVGIVCESYSSPAICGNTITENGGGISCRHSSPAVSGNVISDNTYGGVSCLGPAIMTNNIIARNGCYGISWEPYSAPATGVIRNNTIAGNGLACGGCGIYWGYLPPLITNNIVAFNWLGLASEDPGTYLLDHNCVYGNASCDYSGVLPGADDILANPVFAGMPVGDYHLRANSPCIDVGTNEGAPASDLDGAIRPQDGDGDGNAVCDVGAYEYPLNLGNAKSKLTDGSPIAFGTAAVTAAFAGEGFIYVEKPDRSSGIRVNTPLAFDEGQLVNIQGTMQTDPESGERCISPAPAWPQAAGGVIKLKGIGMSNACLGGGPSGLQDGVWNLAGKATGNERWTQSIGLNNLGLLVTIVGKVTYSDIGFFYIDDGSGVYDGSGHIGVKVRADWLDVPYSGYVKVTGISTGEKEINGKMLRVLKVGKQEDIVPL